MNNFFKKHNFQTFDLKDISQLKEKQAIAQEVALNAKDGDCIGVGSGTTSYLVLIEIDRLIKENKLTGLSFVASSIEIELTLTRLGLSIESLLSRNPDWLFDGADWVSDDELFIKGRGGALFKEKILFASTKKRLLCVDQTKLVEKLNQTMSIPIEVERFSLNHVLARLESIGALDVEIRKGTGKDGPVITENGNLLLDASFKNIDSDLEKEIKLITGVIESGLFTGFDVDLITY
jgi:ribose 5-phosphate isomerase A